MFVNYPNATVTARIFHSLPFPAFIRAFYVNFVPKAAFKGTIARMLIHIVREKRFIAIMTSPDRIVFSHVSTSFANRVRREIETAEYCFFSLCSLKILKSQGEI